MAGDAPTVAGRLLGQTQRATGGRAAAAAVEKARFARKPAWPARPDGGKKPLAAPTDRASCAALKN